MNPKMNTIPPKRNKVSFQVFDSKGSQLIAYVHSTSGQKKYQQLSMNATARMMKPRILRFIVLNQLHRNQRRPLVETPKGKGFFFIDGGKKRKGEPQPSRSLPRLVRTKYLFAFFLHGGKESQRD